MFNICVQHVRQHGHHCVMQNIFFALIVSDVDKVLMILKLGLGLQYRLVKISIRSMDMVIIGTLRPSVTGNSTLSKNE
jgi:hypothetical protein